MLRSAQQATFIATVLRVAICTTVVGCTSSVQPLSRAVKAFNDHLRWQRIVPAAQYLPAGRRSNFVDRHLKAEEDLRIHALEIRYIAPVPESSPPQAKAHIVAKANLLPSTVVKRIVLTQTWEHSEVGWQLVATTNDFLPQEPPAQPSKTVPQPPQESVANPTGPHGPPS